MQTHTPITTQTHAVPDQWLDHYVREAQHLAPIYTGPDGRVNAQALAERDVRHGRPRALLYRERDQRRRCEPRDQRQREKRS